MAELRIVQGGLHHLGALVPLFDAYRVFYKQRSDVEGARVYLQDRLSGLEVVVFLAFQEDKPAGFTLLLPTFSSVSMGRVWTLNDLFVVPDLRGQGVGEVLLERAATFAEQTAALRLDLITQVDNIKAQRLYEKTGWQRDTEFYRYSRVVPSEL